MKDPANTVTVDLNLSQDRQRRYLAALRRRYNKLTWGLPWLIARAVREVVAMEEQDPTLLEGEK